MRRQLLCTTALLALLACPAPSIATTGGDAIDDPSVCAPSPQAKDAYAAKTSKILLTRDTRPHPLYIRSAS